MSENGEGARLQRDFDAMLADERRPEGKLLRRYGYRILQEVRAFST